MSHDIKHVTCIWLSSFYPLRPEGEKSVESDPALRVGFHGEADELIIPGIVRAQTEHVLGHCGSDGDVCVCVCVCEVKRKERLCQACYYL